ncbi:RHS repeat domain-containing protein [Hymenobacter cellulosilyticus]|uniref:RHS repeat-associated core domain-containing protein n=1 Tax=Hymenobacter cellulosilyticus TaxID=2932248 RepID=A0A8T9QC71_9BACT|nr:RHS repeat-associated core domain-containing protein [Hymenobacter cellulosilyticus]UOQ75194.1 hypothetical protein MUN79_28815 [Hymenobacter cellulosilyticus]
MEHTNSTIVQEQHQYAFGSPLTGLNYSIGDKRYRHGYQGQYAEKDEETGYDSFELRLYNSRIGRWMAPDPEGQFYSPYVGMGNNPVSGIDPDGGWSGPRPHVGGAAGKFRALSQKAFTRGATSTRALGVAAQGARSAARAQGAGAATNKQNSPPKRNEPSIADNLKRTALVLIINQVSQLDILQNAAEYVFDDFTEGVSELLDCGCPDVTPNPGVNPSNKPILQMSGAARNAAEGRSFADLQKFARDHADDMNAFFKSGEK